MIPYFNSNNLCIYNQDFLEFKIEKNINLIITSPPYNLGKIYNLYKDDLTYDDYLEFTENWLRKAYEISADDTRLCINIPDFTIVGGKHLYNSGDTYLKALKAGWNFAFSIIWNKANVHKRTAWGSWLSASSPSLISPCEIILIFYKNSWKRLEKGESDIERREFIDWTLAYWAFPGQQSKLVGNHPSPFPIELPKRCIKLFSYKDDIILDPFLGSGSTLIAALETKRKGIGIEIDKDYCKIAEQRIKNNKLFNTSRLNNY